MRIIPAASAAVAALALMSCGGTGGDGNDNGGYGAGEEEPTAAAPVDADESLAIEAAFEPYGDDATAVTYDEGLVPNGSEVDVTVTPTQDSTQFSLEVDDLEPDREYGAHLHTDQCGSHPDDSGPHYQDELDPEQPSTDPTYANPDNEVWLDFTTDDDGDAESETEVNWHVRTGEAQSIVIHADHTSHEPGAAGQAGDRLACVNVPL
ncbi:superoxide dismutase family protein [Spiractinospora alimapuensis]|uniref:superoxide dismutase family protein n=1 Tax=Spiractinospora alimapuensis TaxID=2820884 RepID=UPI001F42156C|nr:superoxide dismutase family protein [Spiractinospora alimapuensis]